MLVLPFLTFCVCISAARCEGAATPGRAPNIVYILADDLGYGDVKALNADGKIATPNLDRLAGEGMVFTDAHSSSSVCTPTRYGVLTGRYNWRSRLQKFVLFGYSEPLIDQGRTTVASLLKQHGYATVGIGKWHLGLGWAKLDKPAKKGGGWNIDYTKPIKYGPTTLGFDYFFGISASLDMPPYVYIRNDRVVQPPTVEKGWGRQGPAAEDFEAVDVLPRLAEEAMDAIERHAAGAKSGKPLFLYMPLNSPHTPIVPNEQFRGKSGISPYADFVMETDWVVGQVLQTLERQGLRDNTLVIFTADNGCSPAAGFPTLLKHGHDPSYIFRGYKADIYDGGHRVPFLVRWPGKVKPGSRSDQTICHTDLMATCADILGVKLPEGAGVDSVSILPALEGRDDKPLREATIHHSIDGNFAIRQGDWKLALCPGSGGWSQPRPGGAPEGSPPVQLYNLADDPGERHNVVADHPDIVRRLSLLLEAYVAEGRSTPGPKEENDAEINIYKGHKPAVMP